MEINIIVDKRQSTKGKRGLMKIVYYVILEVQRLIIFFFCAAYELFGLAKSLQKSYLLPSQLLMYLLSPYVIKVLRVFTFGCTLTLSFITNVCKTLEYQTK